MAAPRKWLERLRPRVPSGRPVDPGPFTLVRVPIRRGEIEVGTLGKGPLVVLLSGRGGAPTERLLPLASALADAGFSVVAVNPRGVGGSRGPTRGLTLHDLAGDVAAVIRHFGASAHVVGAALGNRVARCLATDSPELVRSVVLLAAGGLLPPVPKHEREARAAGAGADDFRDPILTAEASWPEAGRSHARAAAATPLAEWWSGGEAQILVVQGLEDVIAVPENGRRLKAEHPERVRLVEVERAGHGVVDDRADVAIPAVLSFLREMEARHD